MAGITVTSSDDHGMRNQLSYMVRTADKLDRALKSLRDNRSPKATFPEEFTAAVDAAQYTLPRLRRAALTLVGSG